MESLQEIKGLREELSTRLNANDTMEIIREKEEQIRGLLEEGEKLSKQQLQHSNIIKKLRVKEKESDNRITKQQKKIKDLEEELSQLQQVRLSYSTKLTLFWKDNIAIGPCCFVCSQLCSCHSAPFDA